MNHEYSVPVQARLRRLRRSPFLRSMVRETAISKNDFIYPMFVCDGKNRYEEISSMPGIARLSVDNFEKEVIKLTQKGIKSILLFGIPNDKDACGSSAVNPNGCVQQAIRAAKEIAPELVVISDICLCEFTDHGHCGVIENNHVHNDKTLDLLSEMALSHAQAGVDLIAPSAMMDGQIGSLRFALDQAGLTEMPIMAYSAKFSSSFYGPFREAAKSAPQFGDRKAYQMDPANAREALEEIRLDIEQGADIVMVKPGLAYLDILARARLEFNKPMAVYNVSGEYSMVKAAAAAGYIDEKNVAIECALAFKRAGADLIISYFTPQMLEWLES